MGVAWKPCSTSGLASNFRYTSFVVIFNLALSYRLPSRKGDARHHGPSPHVKIMVPLVNNFFSFNSLLIVFYYNNFLFPAIIFKNSLIKMNSTYPCVYTSSQYCLSWGPSGLLYTKQHLAGTQSTNDLQAGKSWVLGTILTIFIWMRASRLKLYDGALTTYFWSLAIAEHIATVPVSVVVTSMMYGRKWSAMHIAGPSWY